VKRTTIAKVLASVVPLLGFGVSASSCGSDSSTPPPASTATPTPTATATATQTATDEDPPEVQTGERLFLETRFAQFFFAHSNGAVNQPLAQGDAVVDTSETTGPPLPGPFQGTSINCRSCHLVDELQDNAGGGVRSYEDFARHSPIPARDGVGGTTTRNSPTMVNATLPRDVPLMLHLDGEFASTEDLVRGTFTGRNLGWLPTESATAVAHIANVIRNDDGTGELAADYHSLPYRVALQGTDPSIPADLRLPAEYRIDVEQSTDSQILDAVAKLVTAYTDSLRFSTDAGGEYNGSPYDIFLEKNDLPRSPAAGESNLAYSQRLLGQINQISEPIFVTPADGSFQFHDQPFQFGATELQGLKVFFSQPSSATQATHGVGNCVTCHTPPNFSDFRFHNTGASQLEYDAIYGNGSFAALQIPALTERNASFDMYLPASANHPNAAGRFRTQPVAGQPGFADLGVWSVFANPDIPTPQGALTQILCAEFNMPSASCTADALLPLTVGLFKTPPLRDLGQSGPYFHTGGTDTFEEVINFYISISAMARNSQVRNPAAELSSIVLDSSDVAPLSSFLMSLNEDYS